MPPSTTMATIITLSIRLKLSGLTKPWKAANMLPLTPPKVAPMPKASSFMLRVLMPIALAAISSSRIAIQARPMRLVSRRWQMTTLATTRIRNR